MACRHRQLRLPYRVRNKSFVANGTFPKRARVDHLQGFFGRRSKQDETRANALKVVRSDHFSVHTLFESFNELRSNAHKVVVLSLNRTRSAYTPRNVVIQHTWSPHPVPGGDFVGRCSSSLDLLKLPLAVGGLRHTLRRDLRSHR